MKWKIPQITVGELKRLCTRQRSRISNAAKQAAATTSAVAEGQGKPNEKKTTEPPAKKATAAKAKAKKAAAKPSELAPKKEAAAKAKKSVNRINPDDVKEYPMVGELPDHTEVRLRYLKDRTGVLQIFDSKGAVYGTALDGRRQWKDIATAKKCMEKLYHEYRTGSMGRSRAKDRFEEIRLMFDGPMPRPDKKTRTE